MGDDADDGGNHQERDHWLDDRRLGKSSGDIIHSAAFGCSI
jgi:hypothetical protein